MDGLPPACPARPPQEDGQLLGINSTDWEGTLRKPEVERQPALLPQPALRHQLALLRQPALRRQPALLRQPGSMGASSPSRIAFITASNWLCVSSLYRMLFT
jgi:hypothetical protein